MNKLTSRVVPLPIDDIDTDQIIPARFLKVTSREGLVLFADWRAAGKPAAILDRDEARGCAILLAGRNFGCGSSREHAPWALVAGGFRAVVASSFADIFKGNALKNGLLPIEVDGDTLTALHAARASDPWFEITVDVDAQVLSARQITAPFPLEPFAKRCLVDGVDELGYLLAHLPEIEAHEARG